MLSGGVMSARAEFAIDRSAVSEKYWAIWNDDEQRKIDADIEMMKWGQTPCAAGFQAPTARPFAFLL